MFPQELIQTLESCSPEELNKIKRLLDIQDFDSHPDFPLRVGPLKDDPDYTVEPLTDEQKNKFMEDISNCFRNNKKK